MVSRFEDGTSVGLRYLTDEVECLSFKQGTCCGWGKSYPAYSQKNRSSQHLNGRVPLWHAPLRRGDLSDAVTDYCFAGRAKSAVTACASGQRCVTVFKRVLKRTPSAP